jgi:hypothetical protein
VDVQTASSDEVIDDVAVPPGYMSPLSSGETVMVACFEAFWPGSERCELNYLD